MVGWVRKVVVALSVCLGFFVLSANPFVAAQNTQNFAIRSFSADYYLNRTSKNVGTMSVNEAIVAVFPSYDQNHGILRALPETYKGLPLNLKVTSVTNELGKSYKYTTSHQNGNLVLKIGDANSYVHGVQTYRIVYSLQNQISFYSDHDELYWDVNGDQWQQPFGEVTARVHIPATIAKGLQDRQVCYSGSYGSTEQNCTIARAGDKNGDVEVVTKAYNLGVGENVSFVLGFDKGTFAVDKAAIRAKQLKTVLTVGLLVGPPLTAFIVIVSRWRKYGRDPKGRGVIVPEYTPPKALNPLTSDVILHESVRSQAVSALIIDLAIRGYIEIYETDKKGLLKRGSDYELALGKAGNDLTDNERDVIKMLFTNIDSVGTRVKVSDLKNKLATEFKSLSKNVPKRMFAAGYFANDPNKVTKRYLGIGSALMVAGFLFTFFIAVHLGIMAIALGVGILISGIVVTVSAKVMPAKSLKGVELHDHLLGLKEYIKLAEADRIKYLQSPEGIKQYGSPDDPKTKIKLFEKLLPYAMLFGLEKEWAKQFKDIYKEAPDWYHGNWSTFNTIYFVNSINSFSTASLPVFSAPSSSGSSGFGGGGFSGGGGGGGGGGW